ncbi:uncharacterized protein LOC134571374 [Pelobates fuscus]|uniref:uncharacterized protein LOC134571374 n=1 Tax=Pelobates fuscus TaxID=191477 RepID=UPI002FE46EC1
MLHIHPSIHKKNWIIVFGDLDEKECEKDKCSKTATPDFCNKLICYTKSDIKLFKEKLPLFQKAKEKLRDMEKIMKTSQGSPGYLLSYIMHSPKHTVGIFSRSGQDEYSWLQTLLRSKGFRDCVQEVRPCYISNSGYRHFTQDVSQCTFGILYHTKNRGRINITDVMDSLYNKELKYLSDTLGKRLFIVPMQGVFFNIFQEHSPLDLRGDYVKVQSTHCNGI